MKEAHFDTAAKIEVEFGLPHSVIIERLLRLLEEGYIAVRRSNVGALRLTRKSYDWLARNEARPGGKEFKLRSTPVLMELISGHLMRTKDERHKPLTERDLERSYRFPLATHTLPQWVEGDSWDETSARHLFRHRERVHKVFPPTGETTKLYWPVDVIPAQRKVIGLPKAWRHLEARILDYTYVLGETYHPTSFWDKRDAEPLADTDEWSALDLQKADLLRTQAELLRAAEDAISDLAKGGVLLIVTPDFDPVWFVNTWSSLLARILRKGAEVDLLWNSRMTEPRIIRGIQQTLSEFAESARGTAGRFYHNQLPAAQCETSLLAVSSPEAGVEIILGAPSWLSNAPGPWVAARIRGESEVVGEAVGIAAALISRCWSRDTLGSTHEPSHWREVATKLLTRRYPPAESLRAFRADFHCSARLVRSYDFEPLAEMLALKARQRFVLYCPMVKPTVRGALVRRLRESFEVGQQEIDSSPTHEDVQVIEKGGFHLITDDFCLFGGPPILGERRNVVQIGLMLQSRDLADYLFSGPVVNPRESEAS